MSLSLLSMITRMSLMANRNLLSIVTFKLSTLIFILFTPFIISVILNVKIKICMPTCMLSYVDSSNSFMLAFDQG